MTDQSLQGVELLQLSRVTVSQEYQKEATPLGSGPATLLLVSAQKASVDDAYLVISVQQQGEKKEPLEIIISSEHVVTRHSSNQGNKYSVKTAGFDDGHVAITLPPQSGQEEHSFTEILEQYCGIQQSASDALNQAQGTVEILDDNGKVIGSLDRSIQPSNSNDDLTGKGQPMLVTVDDDPNPVLATTAQPQQKDWLVNGAQYVTKGLMSVSGFLGGGVEKAANKYTGGRKSGSTTPDSSNPGAYSLPPPEKYTDSKSGTGLDSSAYATDGSTTTTGTNTAGPSRVGGRQLPVHNSITKGLASLDQGSGKVVQLSGSARGALLNTVEGAGRRIGGVRKNKDGSAREPGAVRKQVQRGAEAANIVLEGVDNAVGGLLSSLGSSSSQVIGHTFGTQAQGAGDSIGHVGKNCFLVYRDISGVRRKCLLKLAGGTLKGRTVDGKEIVIEPETLNQGSAAGAGTTASTSGVGPSSTATQSKSISGKVPTPGASSSSTAADPPSYSDTKQLGGGGYSGDIKKGGL